MRPLNHNIRRFCTVIIGTVFFAAGLLKLIDPVGAGMVIGEYFKFFHLGFLVILAKPAGVFLSLLETITGAALITGVYRAIAAWTAYVLIVVFTIVTLILWIFNPAMDCGCFGEAIHLTHAQTFIKNLVLLVLGSVAFLPFRDFGRAKKRKIFTFRLSVASILALSIYSLFNIPLVDFTPFNSSSMLAAAKSYNNGTEQEKYVMSFVYEKNGHEGSFTIDRLPDSTWTYVRTEPLKKTDTIVEDSYPSLSFRNAEGSYCDYLAADSSVIVVSAYMPEKLKADDWNRIGRLLTDAASVGYVPVLLLASNIGTAENLIPKEGIDTKERIQLLMSAYYSDYKTLISLNRSNGGATYFNDGNLIEKWSYRHYPKKEDLGWRLWHDSVDNMIHASTKGHFAFQAYILYSIIILFLI